MSSERVKHLEVLPTCDACRGTILPNDTVFACMDLNPKPFNTLFRRKITNLS